MKPKQPLPWALLAVLGLLTIVVACLLAGFAYVALNWWQPHGLHLHLSLWSQPRMVACVALLLVVGLALGSFEFARAVRRRPRFLLRVTFLILGGAVLVAPPFILEGLQAQRRSASTEMRNDLRLPEPQGQTTPAAKDR